MNFHLTTMEKQICKIIFQTIVFFTFDAQNSRTPIKFLWSALWVLETSVNDKQKLLFESIAILFYRILR